MKKKIGKLILILAAAIGLLAAGIFGANKLGEAKFRKEGSAERIRSGLTRKTLEQIEESGRDYDDLSNAIGDVIGSAKPMDKKYDPAIQTLKNAIRKYFSDQYRIDFTDALEKLAIYVGSMEQTMPGVIGFHYNGAVYIERTFLEGGNFGQGSENDLPDGRFNDLIVHETLHYLVGQHTEIDGEYIDEGVIENLTQTILAYNSLPCEVSVSAYTPILRTAEMIVNADPSLVRALFTEAGFTYANYFATRHGVDFFEDFNRIVRTVYSTEKSSANLRYALQYYTAEIVKREAGGLPQTYRFTICPFFGLHYLLNK